jgi:glycosyltransferase involved in cell wall biosynthesis
MANRKPRVLRIINRLNLGGPTYNAAYLTKYMDEFETLLVSGMHDETEESSEFIVNELGLKPMYLPEMYRELNPFRDYKSYFRLRQIIKDFKPDIVHTHAAKAGAVGRLAARHAGVPIILHTFHGHVFHSYFSPAKTKMFLAIEKYLARYSTKIIALSPKQLLELTDEFNIAAKSKFEVVNLGFDLQRFAENKEEKRKAFRAEYNIQDDEIAIGIVGRLVPIKNHSLFLNGLKKLSENTDKKIRAFIIGDGELRSSIEAEATALGIPFSAVKQNSSLLTFTSWIKDVSVCNAGLDVIALTSNNEGTPVSLIEAQAAGKPIVSTKVGGIEDIVEEGKTALLCPKQDVDAFAKALTMLVNDDNLRKAMSSEGSGYALNQFSYKRLCADMTKLYNSLLNGDKSVAQSA